MQGRRQFIQRGLAAVALATGASTAPAILDLILHDTKRPSWNGGGRLLFKVLFDETSAAGLSFAAEAARHFIPTRGVGTDVGATWMHDIEPRWRHSPAAIAGLTTGPALFCLELLARDHGMGVVYRARHDPDRGRFSHIVAGPPAITARAGELVAGGSRWAEVAAAIAIGCPACLRPDLALGLVDLAERAGVSERSLFSWVIAPADGRPAFARREA